MGEGLADEIGQLLQQHADVDKAQKMQAYMKGNFVYFGINSPGLKLLLADYFKEHKYPDAAGLSQVLEDLWDYDEREMQYVGLRLVRKFVKKQPSPFIHILENLITRKSWWDTVDALSVDAGTLLKIHSKLQPDMTDRWIVSENMWLQRAAIIHQLMYKDDTNWNLLQGYILQVCHHPEFFLRKAAGWALRQYSKTSPDKVRSFIKEHEGKLSGLTIREGSKYL